MLDWEESTKYSREIVMNRSRRWWRSSCKAEEIRISTGSDDSLFWTVRLHRRRSATSQLSKSQIDLCQSQWYRGGDPWPFGAPFTGCPPLYSISLRMRSSVCGKYGSTPNVRR